MVTNKANVVFSVIFFEKIYKLKFITDIALKAKILTNFGCGVNNF